MIKQTHLLGSMICRPRGALGYGGYFGLRSDQRDEIRRRLRDSDRQNRLALMDTLFDIYIC